MRKFQVKVNGNTYEVEIEELKAGASVTPTQVNTVMSTVVQTVQTVAPSENESVGATLLEAPMQGKIISVKVDIGQIVEVGDVVAVLEAMKMENEIVAPKSGTIASVDVASGQTVETGDLIASLN